MLSNLAKSLVVKVGLKIDPLGIIAVGIPCKTKKPFWVSSQQSVLADVCREKARAVSFGKIPECLCAKSWER